MHSYRYVCLVNREHGTNWLQHKYGKSLSAMMHASCIRYCAADIACYILRKLDAFGPKVLGECLQVDIAVKPQDQLDVYTCTCAVVYGWVLSFDLDLNLTFPIQHMYTGTHEPPCESRQKQEPGPRRHICIRMPSSISIHQVLPKLAWRGSLSIFGSHAANQL